MRTHYIPEFLLKRFRGAVLLELNKATGEARQTSLDNAGSGDDLWPKDIENGVMGKPDNEASRILTRKVWGKSTIDLSHEERYTLAQWLALFVARVPIAAQALRTMIADAEKDPEIAVRRLMEEPDAVLRAMHASNPAAYEQAIAEFGKAEGERWLLDIAAALVRERRVKYVPDAEATYHTHLREATSLTERLASRLVAMEWTWYHTEIGFCIGDNPLCRWHVPTGQALWGIVDHRHVETTFPMSSELTLCMSRRRGQGSTPRVLECKRDRTRQFNHRQRASAAVVVYGPSPELLNPQSRLGFNMPVAASLWDREIRPPRGFYR